MSHYPGLAHDGTHLVIVEPASQSIIEEVATASQQGVDDAVASAVKAQAAWALRPLSDRAMILLRWRKALVDASENICRTLSRENGKPLHEALLHELAPLCGALTWLADEAPAVLSERALSLRWLKQYKSRLSCRPRGLCAIISPYNFPLLIPFADAAAALVAGCAVLIKPSEHTPLTAIAAAKLAYAAGLEPSLLQVLPGGADVGRHLLHAGVDEVVFTGSVEHGRDVARRCAEQLIPCTLELGGKAPLIVLEDVHPEEVAGAIVFGALANSGQNCVAVERVIVHRSVRRRLVDAIADRMAALRQGDPLTTEVDLGALTSLCHVGHIRQQVEAAIAQGARLVRGGHRTHERSHFFLPTLLDDCTAEMAVANEETFGPVVPVLSVESVDGAIRIANSGPSSLAAYVFGRNERALNALSAQMRASHVLFNDVLWSYICPEIPFGGHHECGWGVVHGIEGLRAHTRSVHIGATRIRLPQSLGLGFPYSTARRQLLARALQFITR